MGPALKALLVAVGYAAAAAAGMAAARLQNMRGSGHSDGMVAFSETLVFVFVFGLASLLPTGAALYWLRAHAGFWIVISRLALSVAVTAVAAVLLVMLAPEMSWAAIGLLRLFLTPLLAAGFVLSAVLAPDRSSRALLSIAAALESAGALYGYVRLFAAYAP